ncbi:MAG: hypothetical protein NXI22_15750 [bacterium]|nr:hypothetical protein [bacterium]
MKRFAIFTILLSLAGCGTLRNVSPPVGYSDPTYAPNILFGGVHDDVALMGRAVEDIKQFPNSQNSVPGNLKEMAIHSADIPFSAVGDALTANMVVVNDYGRRSRLHEERISATEIAASKHLEISGMESSGSQR